MKITVENDFTIVTVEEKMPRAAIGSLIDSFRAIAFFLGFSFQTVNEALPTDGE